MYYFPKLFFTCILLLCWLSSSGQLQYQLDSVKSLMEETDEVVEKARLLHLLAMGYRSSSLQQAIIYNKKAIDVLPKDNLNRLAHYYSSLGALYSIKSLVPKACMYIDSAIVLFRELDDEKGLATAYSNLSSLYIQVDRYEEALEKVHKSLAINEKTGNKKEIAHNLTALVSINLVQNELKKGLVNGKRALSFYEGSDNKTIATINLGIIYDRMGQVDSAFYYFNEGLDLATKNQNKNNIATTYLYLGMLYHKGKEWIAAAEYLQKALELEQFIMREGVKIQIKNTLAEIYFEKKAYTKSIFFNKKALETANELKLIKYAKDALTGLSKNYAALKNYEEAYRYNLKVLALKDSILDETKQGQIKELEIKYETEKKEQNNVLLTKERNLESLRATRNQIIAFSSIVVLVLFLIISYLLVRQFRNRYVQQTLQLKYQLLRNQMNPHFIFNSLAAIQSYIYEKDARETSRYLSAFAKLVRAILENSREEYITLFKEIQWLENYLKLQSLRFNSKFEYHLHLDENLDLESVLIPPMLTQPFIENALEHGLSNIEYMGVLDIEFSLQKEFLEISVRDNGVGLDGAKAQKMDDFHISLATTITKERLDFLNQNSNKKIYFDISNVLPKGTQVKFSIPLKQRY